MAKTASFGPALRAFRKARNLSQEDFSDVSSRTYLSSLERGLKSPTIGKVEAICQELAIHPLTLLTIAYGGIDASSIEKVLAQVRSELKKILLIMP